MQPKPWRSIPVKKENFQKPPREYGILPFWFLNGELELNEMLYQLREFRDKGMPGIILHGRYGLETDYIGETYLHRIHFAVEEAEKLGLQTWIYDEMNWPSGTADQRVLKARPDLAQRYIECLNFTVRGPWFTYLTGADSRYNDFEKSTPVAAFAVRLDGEQEVIDLTPNLSFHDVIPWEAPTGNWRLMYIVEKVADYYIDAMNPESTEEFLKYGYDPYASAMDGKMSSQMLGFYTDEPAMHYYLSGAENPVVPWTKNMFRRFQERNGYNLRPRLPDLFFDIRPDSARVRYDFYNTLTDFYSDAYYKQIHEWCQRHNVLFTGHLLYEEWLRRLIRVEGNLFKHYRHMDVVGVDHLYPIIGNRDRPDEHVAMKVGSSAAHQLRSPRLLCESFGGIFMDATMQRMKWIADWEYVLGVNLLNPHGFHYTLEGPRKRDWPPSMFYQYPWWQYYGEFSDYISRLSHLLSGGKHIAKVAVLWPMNAMFATYTPQAHNAIGDRIERDFNALTDLLLRLHYDYDYLDEDVLDNTELDGNTIRMGDEAHELLILPPMTHIKLSTLAKLEQFVSQGGRVLGTIFLPSQAFTRTDKVTEQIDISDRIHTLFGVEPIETQKNFLKQTGLGLVEQEHPGGGKTAFLRSYAINRQLPWRVQQELGTPGKPESPFFVIESEERTSRYFFAPEGGNRQEITNEVNAEREAVADALEGAVLMLIEPDIVIDNREIFYLHRQNDRQEIYFLVNPTYAAQQARVGLPGAVQPVHWDPSTGVERLIAPSQVTEGRTYFTLELSPVGSAFILVKPDSGWRVVETNVNIDSMDGNQIRSYGRVSEAFAVIEKEGQEQRLIVQAEELASPLTLDGLWEFQPENENALVISKWRAMHETSGRDLNAYAQTDADTQNWQSMVPGAWSYQLSAEPESEYPIPVWYRTSFQANYLPPKLNLIMDGFAGSEWSLFINGERVTPKPVRSQIDGQMQAVDITPYLRQGENLIALRLVVTNPTDGLLDLLKLTGDFSLAPQSNDGQTYSMEAPRTALRPEAWTNQGYPYFSGRAIYRKRFELPASFNGQRIFLEPEMQDDVLEAIVNGQSAGVRLWEPYQMEITDLVNPGENTIELRVANTLVNLLEAVERHSGIAGAPKLVPYHTFTLDLTNK